MASESAMHFLLPKPTHPYKQCFNGGAGTPVVSDSSHPAVHTSATAADTPSNAAVASGARQVPERTAAAPVCIPVGLSPLQGALQATVR